MSSTNRCGPCSTCGTRESRAGSCAQRGVARPLRSSRSRSNSRTERAARLSFAIPDCAVAAGDFELRVFSLASRQRMGVKVDAAREYFKQFGGVHVYDAGFHLPYYGPDTDWLHIEIDHSHRLSRSALLPPALQVPNGMNNLPTQSRVFGSTCLHLGRTGGWISRGPPRLPQDAGLARSTCRQSLLRAVPRGTLGTRPLRNGGDAP